MAGMAVQKFGVFTQDIAHFCLKINNRLEKSWRNKKLLTPINP
jgi:hypothetical protein